MSIRNYFQKFIMICTNVFQKEIRFILLVFFFNFATHMFFLIESGKISKLVNYTFSAIFISFCFGVIINLIHSNYVKNLLKFLLISILSILFLVESFIVYYYKTSIGAGIINVILETNQREAIEFLNTYINLSMVLLVVAFIGIFLSFIYFLGRYIKKIGIVKLQKGLLVMLIVGAICTIRGVYIYNDYDEEFLLPRVYASTKVAMKNINEYENLYSKLNDQPVITENKAQIKNIVFIVGESTNRNHMSIYDYYNNTTPNLKRMQEQQKLFIFKDIISPHSHTSPVISKLFTFCNFESEEPWYTNNNIVSIFKQAGYKTYWLSNQESSGIWGNVAQIFSNLSNRKVFTRYRDSNEDDEVYDELLLPILDKELENKVEKNFFVIHLMGTHGAYHKRYPKEYNVFHEQDIKSDFDSDKKQTIAKYDNAVLYNDYIIQQIINRFKNEEAIVIYLSDHGEEVYDYRDFAGHTEDNGSKYMVEIPMIIWTSDLFSEKYSGKVEQIRNSTEKPYMTDDLIHTLLDLSDIKTPEFDETRSLINKNFNPQRKRIYHNQNYDIDLKS
ncbi:phosphoethanolamine transferase [Anaerosinus massiliensis]|uniref:phosphoethanolamine transferase n=1 Tax=Massilibacillus massiliensis TaxID=1806837 RepID=UPI000AF4C8E8|nr:phosphoethanolamine transferase [Massilibacillus massiliensis]